MDDNLYQDDFEEFLQDQVGNQRMYPSDAVWRNINKELHGDNKWPALTVSAFAVLIATVAVCIHFSPKPNIFAISPAYNQKSNVAGNNNQIANLSSPSFLNNSKAHNPQQKNVDVSAAKTAIVKDIINVERQKYTSTANSVKSTYNELAKVIPLNTNSFRQIDNYNSSVTTPSLLQTTKDFVTNIPAQSSTSLSSTVPPSNPQPNPSDDKNPVDNFLKEHTSDLALYTTTQVKSFKNRFSYILYIAPSVSYRKLTEDRAGLRENTNAGGPVALNYVTDVNQVVRHKPGTGIEAGFGIIYNLSNKVRLKSGLQFNIRQYNIEAYRSAAEPASIALVTGNRIDTINTISVYRTNNGYLSAELTNRYYQIAVPLGLEWEVIGNKNIQLNVAGSIQPTYLVNKNAYLISTNYKNYTETRGMINSWNLNSNIEAFISFKVGDFKWQLGPQLRYQHYSTFISSYPIKEHLMDYGFKLGVSKIIL